MVFGMLFLGSEIKGGSIIGSQMIFEIWTRTRAVLKGHLVQRSRHIQKDDPAWSCQLTRPSWRIPFFKTKKQGRNRKRVSFQPKTNTTVSGKKSLPTFILHVDCIFTKMGIASTTHMIPNFGFLFGRPEEPASWRGSRFQRGPWGTQQVYQYEKHQAHSFIWQ